MCIDMKVSFIKEGLGASLFYVIVTFFKTNFVEVSQKLFSNVILKGKRQSVSEDCSRPCVCCVTIFTVNYQESHRGIASKCYNMPRLSLLPALNIEVKVQI